MERRRFLQAGLSLGVATIAGGLLPSHHPEYEVKQVQRPEILGLTFSQRQCDLLGFSKEDYKYVFHRLLDTLNPDVVRLCIYWDEYEDSSPERIDYLVNHLDKIKKNFILVVGAKSPRYEEIHLPKRIREHVGDISGRVLGEDDYFSEEVLKFDEQILLRYRDCTSLTHFQAENEGLDPLWLVKGATIGPELMTKVTSLFANIRRPNQKTLTTNSLSMSNPTSAREKLLFNAGISEAVGLNIYSKVPRTLFGQAIGYATLQEGAWKSTEALVNELNILNREVWGSEIQGEPWEQGPNGEIIAVHTKQRRYPSSSPRQSLDLIDRASRAGIQRALAWGGEYWVFQELRGDSEWITAHQPVFNSKAA